MHELLAPQNALECPVFAPSATQRRVIARYAAPPWPSFNQAARLEHVKIGTARSWKKGNNGAGFRSLLEQARADAIADHLEEIRTRLVAASTKAVDTVIRAMDDPDTSAALRAAIWNLERTIGKAPEQVRHEGTVHFVLSPGDGHAHG